MTVEAQSAAKAADHCRYEAYTALWPEDELARLEDLEQLWLDDNDIVDPVPVLRMTSLRALDLDGNPRLQCPSSDKVPLNLQLTLPDHCNAT